MGIRMQPEDKGRPFCQPCMPHYAICEILKCPILASPGMLICLTRSFHLHLLDVINQDIDLEYRMKLSSGKLLVKQRIPRGQWELFPSPEFRVSEWEYIDHHATVHKDPRSEGKRIQRVSANNFLLIVL